MKNKAWHNGFTFILGVALIWLIVVVVFGHLMTSYMDRPLVGMNEFHEPEWIETAEGRKYCPCDLPKRYTSIPVLSKQAAKDHIDYETENH